MVITITMNPAIDRTVTIPRLVHGGLNRIQMVETDIGGKGINVSKTIRALGGQSVALGFAGGGNGSLLEKSLKRLGIETAFIPVDGEIRCNTKIVESNGSVTELNEPGFTVEPPQLEALLHRIEDYASKDTVFVLSGSLPKGAGTDVYAEIIQKVRGKGGRVLLDADGEVFRSAVEAVPHIIKPNRMELEQYYGVRGATLEELCKMGEKLMQKGMTAVVISLGREGALFRKKKKPSMGEAWKWRHAQR